MQADLYNGRKTVVVVVVVVVASSSGRVVGASDGSVRGPRFESHSGRLCSSRQPLRNTALGSGCAPLLQCLGRLRLPPPWGGKICIS